MKTNTVSKDFAMTEDMRINITSKDFTLTEAIESKILNKITALDKFAKGKKEVKVNLSTEPAGHKIEVMIDLNGNFLRAQVTSENLYKSIDLVVENLKNQLSNLSDKENDNGRHSVRFMEPESKVEFEEDKPKIVKRKLIAAKPMYEEEAVLQMEVLNHRSFIFINAETNGPCMTYKRNDGDYGIIELV